MRHDAEEKRNRIVAAARRVFAERGDAMPVARIAHHAGVSVATLYRRFPTRDHLLASVYDDQWGECRSTHIAEAVRDPDPARALRRLVRRLGDQQLVDAGFTRAYVDALALGRGLDEPRRQTERLVSGLLEKAKELGTVHGDVTVADVRLLIAGHDGVVRSAGPQAAAASRRYLTMMLRSFGLEARTSSR